MCAVEHVVAGIQAPPPTARVQDNLDRLDARLGELEGRGVGLVITCELSLCGYAVRRADRGDVARALRGAAGLAAAHRTALLVGLATDSGRDRPHDSVALFAADGELAAMHHKTHLFGEERERFTPGEDAPVVVDLDGLRVSPLICYEVEFPEYVRAAAADADLVAVPATLVGDAAQTDPVVDLLVPARAFENQVYVAYVNTCGDRLVDGIGRTTVADPSGSVHGGLGSRPGIVTHAVAPGRVRAARAANPYWRDRRTELYGGIGVTGGREALVTTRETNEVRSTTVARPRGEPGRAGGRERSTIAR